MLDRLQGLFSRDNSARPGPITFDDLTETPAAHKLPPLDREPLDRSGLSPAQREWVDDGVVIRRGFFSDRDLDPYIAVRQQLGAPGSPAFLGGWSSPTPYLHVPELRALALHPPMMALMRELLGEPMMLHLNLTGWTTTSREWHQDDYLNPPFVYSWYAAVWIALDTIDPASGPFQYIPGSHRWKLLRREKVKSFLPRGQRKALSAVGSEIWPTLSQHYVAAAVEAEIERRAVAPVSFLADKGDLLIWHGRLMHRGSAAAVPGMLRRSLIAHYSGINHRPDMKHRRVDANGQAYAWFDHVLQ